VPIAVALGAVILGERLPPRTLVGGVCILGGVVLMLSGARHTKLSGKVTSL
jgi:drug/metabolite transporter (DMT)-like permease